MKLSFCEINCILFVGDGRLGVCRRLWCSNHRQTSRPGIVVIFLLVKCGQTSAAIKAQTTLGAAVFVWVCL